MSLVSKIFHTKFWACENMRVPCQNLVRILLLDLGSYWLVSKLVKPKFGQAKIWAYHTKMRDKNFRMCLEWVPTK
jgi:hypothetical protein